jgi:hypothetical protein
MLLMSCIIITWRIEKSKELVSETWSCASDLHNGYGLMGNLDGVGRTD